MARKKRRQPTPLPLVLSAGLACAAFISVVAIVLTNSDSTAIEAHPVRGNSQTGAKVALYGDSLAYEASGSFVASLRARGANEVIVRTFGGTAICDWLSSIRDEAPQFDADVIVMMFSGNNTTPCMVDPDTGKAAVGDRLLEIYRDYTRQAADALMTQTSAVIVWAAPPPFRLGTPLSERGFLADVYRQAAETSPNRMRYANIGSALTLDGTYTDELPCTDGADCDDGWIQVRSPDGMHLCPVLHTGTDCPVASPGADRLGEALAEASLDALPSSWVSQSAS